MKHELEPLVNQEQGVVYLFARYWENIPKLNKLINKIDTVGVQFPDSFYYDHKDRLGGIEFENRLSGFRKHLIKKSRKIKGKWVKVTDVKWFYKEDDDFEPINARFLIVYWSRDDNELEIKKEFKKQVRRAEIEVINLSDKFFPFIEKDMDKLSAYWKFKKEQKILFKIKNILHLCDRLEKKDLIEFLPQSSSQNIKIMGFNPKNAEDVEYRHWGLINFFTTDSKINANNIPHKIFFKPKDSDSIEAGFKIEKMFKINEGNKLIKEFFKKNYFWLYNDDYRDSTCIVYSNFKIIPEERGKIVFEKIKKVKGWQSRGIIITKEDSPKLYTQLNNL